MPEFTVGFEVYCAKCGEGLCLQSEGGNSRRGMPFVRVEPCAKCLEEAKEEGKEEGREKE